MAIRWDKYKRYDTSEGFGDRKQWRKAFHTRMGADEAKQIIDDQELSPWEILGLSNTASKAEIKAAFHKLIREWHPDHNEHRLELATEMSKKIIAAYTTLK